MSVEKRKRGYKARDHKRNRSASFPRMKEAKIQDAIWYLEHDGPIPTMRELLQDWLKQVSNTKSPAYSDQMIRLTMTHLVPIHDLDWPELTKYHLNKTILTQHSPSMQNRLISALNACFKYHLSDETSETPVVRYNPIEGMAKRPHIPAKPYVPDPEDVDKLLGYMDRNNRDYLMVVETCLETGCRIGEIIWTGLRPEDKWLQWNDVYFGQEPWLKLWTKKTGRSVWDYQEIPVSDEIAKRLKEWKLRTKDQEHVFPWKYTSLHKWLQRCCSAVRIRPFGWHSFRHFFSHHLCESGVPDKRIQTALRHRSIVTTQRYLQNLKRDRTILEHTFKRKPSQTPQKAVKGDVP